MAVLASVCAVQGSAYGVDSIGETLRTPQLQQAAASFTEALNGLGAQGLIAELRLNPTGAPAPHANVPPCPRT